MELSHVTYVGPALDDKEMLAHLPDDLAGLLQQMNGFVQFSGGLHVRGACRAPAWHSLRNAWTGTDAIHRLYPAVRTDDIPFAEDCMGDQFLLRAGQVRQLSAETGELEPMRMGLRKFFDEVEASPVEFLSMQPLLQFIEEGGGLKPGQLLQAWPPFFIKQSEHAVSLAAIPTLERRRFLADIAAQIRDVPDGDWIEFKFVD